MSKNAAVLLAAGSSARMGTAKFRLPWQGKTLLEYQIGALKKAGVTRIILVLGYEAEAARALVATDPAVEIVLNPRYREGKTTSIKAGLQALDPAPRNIIVLGVDQPRTAATLRTILESHEKAGAPVTVPVCEGKTGHPPVFSASLLPELMTISEEKMGLREIVHRFRHETEKVAFSSPEVLLNLNTPRDYEQALRLTGKPR
ncbi:MAG: nucleotidyltransferase family protein [Chloroflexota bacterium]